MSLQAAGEAGWKRGWWEVNSPRKARQYTQSETTAVLFQVKAWQRTVHPPSDFTSLLVAPPDGGEVGLVVHEAGVEVGLLVRVLRVDVDLHESVELKS